MFGFFKKKAPAAAKANPLEAFDQAIESLARQGHEVRRSAATLLTLRKELERDLARAQARHAELTERLAQAEGDAPAQRTLQRDLFDAEKQADELRAAAARAEADGGLLVEAAEELRRRHAELTSERQSARVRLGAGLAVSDALKSRAEQFERVLSLDAARDEVERAHALAEIYREEEKG